MDFVLSLCSPWQSRFLGFRHDPKSPHHLALDNDFRAPNMDTVIQVANIETRSKRPAAVRGTPTADSRPGKRTPESGQPMVSALWFQTIALPQLLDTPCRVNIAVTLTKQTIVTLTKCHRIQWRLDAPLARNTPALRHPCAKIEWSPLQERPFLA